MRILLTEDDADLADSTGRALRSQGWEVDVTARGEPVPLSVARDPYDLLILDIGLPGIDGFETLARVRAQGSKLPVLMLTARDAVGDRVRGLESGADDYLVKPFALDELLARARALVRRSHAHAGDVLTIARLKLDLRARCAFESDATTPIGLTAREWAALAHLAQHAGRIVSKEQLIGAIPGWDDTTSGNAIEVLVSRLRAKIEPAAVRIRTVRGLGYRLEDADR